MNVIVKHHQISRHTGEVRNYLTSLTESDVREPARGPFYALPSEGGNLQPSSSSHRANIPPGQATSAGESCQHLSDSRIGKKLDPFCHAHYQLVRSKYAKQRLPCIRHVRAKPRHQPSLQKGHRQTLRYNSAAGNPSTFLNRTRELRISNDVTGSQVIEVAPTIGTHSRRCNQKGTVEVLPSQIHPSELSEPRQVHL